MVDDSGKRHLGKSVDGVLLVRLEGGWGLFLSFLLSLCLPSFLLMLGYAPGIPLAVYNGVCYQGGRIVSCEEDVSSYVAPETFYAPTPAPAAPVYELRKVLNCAGQYETRKVLKGAPTPVVNCPVLPRVQTLPAPVPSAGPVYGWKPRRMPRAVVRRPYKPRFEPRARERTPSGELCPIAGYVRRPIPGVAEEQIFKCTAGQPVVIDPGIAFMGRQEALARHGLGSLDDFTIGNTIVPTWALIAAIAVGALWFMKARR
jgi:hypothetical protein